MELWIRSQNRNSLIKANNVKTSYGISGYIILVDDKIVGIYSSEKRTLEVLDEIEDKIVINYGYELSTNSGIRPDNIKPKGCYTAVYEMPKE